MIQLHIIRLKLCLIVAVLASLMAAATWISFLILHWSHPGKRYFQQSQFKVGVNYPWMNYGSDFGLSPWGHMGVSEPAIADKVDSDFANLHSLGVTVVRWFAFCDLRSGLVFDGQGRVIGLDNYVLADMQTAVQIAHKHKIKLIFVLLDFLAFNKPSYINGVQLSGRSDLVSDPVKRQSFLDNALKPILAKFGQSDDIIAWEIVNEPEWAMDIPSSMLAGLVNPRLSSFANPRVKTADMQSFVGQAVAYIHKYCQHGATVGSATRGWLSYWTQCAFDVYEYHYYPWMEVRYPYNEPASMLDLDKPIIVGEFATKKGVLSTQQYLGIAEQNGYAGAFAWSMHATDPYTDFTSAAPQINQFTHPPATKLNQGHARLNK